MSLEEVAHHEAGHCVVAAFLGLPVGEVTVVPTETTLGQCDFGLDDSDAGDVRAYMLAVLAGGMADARYRGVAWDCFIRNAEPSHGEDGDLELFRWHLSIYCRLNPGLSAKRIEPLLFIECEQLVSAHWEEICRVARLLVECGTIEYRAYGENPHLPLETQGRP